MGYGPITHFTRVHPISQKTTEQKSNKDLP